MLIAISGRINSGKDTVGRMIQEMVPEKNWEIKKFAGKLKQVASLLTGIPVESFEDQEFKKTELGREWDSIRYKTPTVQRQDGFQDIVSPREAYNHTMTVRELLQKLGTEAIRNGLHENAWVNATFSDYTDTKTIGGWGGIVHPDGRREMTFDDRKVVTQNWIITDCRFPNEAEAVRQREGIVIRIARGEERLDSLHQLHPSETSLDQYAFDYVISNGGSLEELERKVREMLQYFYILPQITNGVNNN